MASQDISQACAGRHGPGLLPEPDGESGEWLVEMFVGGPDGVETVGTWPSRDAAAEKLSESRGRRGQSSASGRVHNSRVVAKVRKSAAAERCLWLETGVLYHDDTAEL